MAGETRKKAAAKKKTAKRSAKGAAKAPSRRSEAGTGDRGDWRGSALARVRALIGQADPAIVEEVKWRKPSNPMGVPVWSRDGILCTGETYQDKVKLTFLRGAALDVTEREPLPADSPLWDLPNVLLSPHRMSIVEAENPLIVELFVDNLRRFLDGRPLRNVFEPDRGY